MESDFTPSPGKISQVIYVKNQLLFPISWLQKQDYCEYQIYLENIKGVKVKPTPAMTSGAQEHERLYQEFTEKAVPATFEQMLSESRKEKIFSREFKVTDIVHGIYGYIDEVWLTPDQFVVIDDKPGFKTFASNIHQIYGYCLAFKSLLNVENARGIVAALRERGTDFIYWKSPFDENAEHEIVSIIDHIQALLTGRAKFAPSDNPNKCRSCRLNPVCGCCIK